MNNINIKNNFNYKENIEDILCIIEEKTDKMIYKNKIVKENLKLVNKYEKLLFKLKEKLYQKKEENKLLKEILIHKRKRRIDINEIIFLYIEYLNLFNNSLNNKLFFYQEKEMLINYKNRLINEFIKSNDNKVNNDFEEKNNEYKKIIKLTNSINLETNENIDYIKPEEIKINRNKIKKKKNKKSHSFNSSKTSINLKNKEKFFFEENETEFKNKNTIINKSLKKNNSEIIENENKFEEINESLIKSDTKKNKNNILKKRNNIKLLKINSDNKSNNITINTEQKELNNKSIPHNHSTYYLIEARENLKKILFKDPVLRSKILNETYHPKIKKSKSIIICNKKNLKTHQKIIKKKNKVILVDQKRNSELRHLFFNNILINSIKNKFLNEEKITNYKLYESLINIIFIKITLYQNIIKKNIFQIIKRFSKCNIHFFINKWIINYLIGKRISNILINLSNIYNINMKNNKIEIINDNKFLDELDFSSNEKINKTNEYKISLLEFKKIEKETKEIEKNISNFTNNIN